MQGMRAFWLAENADEIMVAAQDRVFAIGRVQARFAPGRPGHITGTEGIDQGQQARAMARMSAHQRHYLGTQDAVKVENRARVWGRYAIRLDRDSKTVLQPRAISKRRQGKSGVKYQVKWR